MKRECDEADGLELRLGRRQVLRGASAFAVAETISTGRLQRLLQDPQEHQAERSNIDTACKEVRQDLCHRFRQVTTSAAGVLGSAPSATLETARRILAEALVEVDAFRQRRLRLYADVATSTRALRQLIKLNCPQLRSYYVSTEPVAFPGTSDLFDLAWHDYPALVSLAFETKFYPFRFPPNGYLQPGRSIPIVAWGDPLIGIAYTQEGAVLINGVPAVQYFELIVRSDRSHPWQILRGWHMNLAPGTPTHGLFFRLHFSEADLPGLDDPRLVQYRSDLDRIVRTRERLMAGGATDRRWVYGQTAFHKRTAPARDDAWLMRAMRDRRADIATPKSFARWLDCDLVHSALAPL